MKFNHEFKTYPISFQDSCDHDMYQECMNGGKLILEISEPTPELGELVFLTEIDYHEEDIQGAVTTALARVDKIATSSQGTHSFIWLTYLDLHNFNIHQNNKSTTGTVQ